MINGLLKRLGYVPQELLEQAQRPPVRRVPERRMEAERVKEALAGIVESDGWRAVHQLLDEAIADATDEVSEPPPADGQPGVDRAFSAGGIDALRRFQGRLVDLHELVSLADVEIESEGEL